MVFTELFVHELVHIGLTAAAAWICITVAAREKKKLRRDLYLLSALGAMLGGFFVDLDHVFEYVLAYGLYIDVGAFLSGHMFVRLDKIYVLAHAWEWLVLLGLWVRFTTSIKLRYFLIGLTLGLLTHLVFDQTSNNINIFGYSILYRLINDFNLQSVTRP